MPAPVRPMLIGVGRHRTLAVSAIGAGIANLILSVLLVREMGLIGVAIGTLVPTGVETLVFRLPYMARVLGLTATSILREMMLPPLLPALPTIAILHILVSVVVPNRLVPLLVVIAVGLSVYAFIYLTLGASTSERKIVHQLLSQTASLIRSRE